MGTRGLTCVVKDDEYKVAQYHQWDSYPSGQGSEVLEFLKERYERDEFIQQLDKCKFLTSEEIHKLYKELGADDSGFISMDISDNFKEKYPTLHRDTGAEILDYIRIADDDVLLYNDIEFAKDGLFCEWCYVIDLDNNNLEVYGGFHEEPAPEGSRFGTDIAENGYSAVHPAKTYSLGNLPDLETFCKDLADPDEE